MSSKESSKIQVCFVGLYTYSLFNLETNYRFGGAEVRSSLLSKGLAQAKQFDVVYIVNDYGQPSQEIFNNVTVVPHSRSAYPQWYKQIQTSLQTNTKVSVGQRIKYLLYRTYSIAFKSLPDYLIRPKMNIYKHTILYNRFKRYIEIDADIYISLTVSSLSAEIAAFCKLYDKKYALIIGSDLDLSESYHPDSAEDNIYGSPNNICYYAIVKADHIVTQTNYQSQLLKERFGRSATVMSNPIDLHERIDESPYLDREIALWVGKSDTNKQPEVLIQLAQQFPNIQFIMIMNRYDDTQSQKIIDTSPDNVSIHEFVPYHEIESFFAKAFVLINTSGYEGFPNTFLQAGKYSVPILSYNVDPDDFIQTFQCGIIANGSFDLLIDGLKIIHEDKLTAEIYSQNAFSYVEAHHSLEQKVEQLATIIKDCLDQ